MNVTKEEIGILNNIKRKAYTLSEKVLIVSRPKKAKDFLAEVRKKSFRTRLAYKNLTKKVRLSKHLTHEVENLFDNYYIIDNAISDVLDQATDKGFEKLFQIERKPDVFIPRIYLILSELLKLTEYKIDREMLYIFLQSYQSKAYLSIRELSFVPFFLKVILIENVENVIYKSVVSLDEFKDADYWFGQIVKKGSKEKESYYSKLTSAMTLKYGVIPVNLGFYLLQKLSQYGPDTRPIVRWLKSNLLKQGINISDIAEIENKRQNEISLQISNTINSLRWINQIRWGDFIVDTNIIDPLLKKDPADIYGSLDQVSQNIYRNEVVKIGERAGVYESEVVKLALRLSQQAVKHVGYYLVGAGRDDLQKKIGYRKNLKENLQALIFKKPALFYLGSIFLIDILLTALFVVLLPSALYFSVSSLILLVIVFVLNCDIGVNLLNILISNFIPVRALFRLDLSSGVSSKQATFVVIPSMFRDENSAQELLRKLEVNYLGNSSDNVYFALLMDFRDSNIERLPDDEKLVEEIRRGIIKLNEKYSVGRDKFYLFHRKRIWNYQEKAFMGWERKRGKLREFNLLLRNKRPTSFVESLPADFPFIKYVLTIDEDTRLPKDSAIKLIGCIDHPLNRPVVDPVSQKVVSGYGIIQPRMTTSFHFARATIFSRLFSTSIGLDSYSGPVADVYQDLFNNSIFYGKGIYDIDTMETTIGDRIPENQILSHDLLEGLYTRVGFATDIFLFEGFPESYREYAVRMHRWIRGDWQIISWLKYNLAKNNLFSLSDKWKIIDNLRRSLVPLAVILFLGISLLSFFASFSFSFAFALLAISSSFIISYLIRFFVWSREMTVFMKIIAGFAGLEDLFWQIMYRLIFVLDQAVISFGAIIISLYRLIISHKNLLHWQNSHEVSKGLRGTMGEFIYTMWPGQIISLILILFLPRSDNFFLYLMLLLWLLAPVVAFQISQKGKAYEYSSKDRDFLRRIACRSARFFLELSSRDGNHLIPDHYQEEPATNSPAATSPTNIGMHLLSNLSAYDLGYISFSNFLERTAELSDSLDSLEKYRGHFYNWYDIRTLQPLAPKYVSSVDSANLLVSIIALKRGVLDIIEKPIITKNSLSGLDTVLAVLAEDAILLAKDSSLPGSERKLAKTIYNEVKLTLKKYGNIQPEISVESLIKIFSYLAEVNEKIKKMIGGLNFSLSKGVPFSIYSSMDHFNILLKQQIGELEPFISFYQLNRARPVIRNEKKNRALLTATKELFGCSNTISSLEYFCSDFKAGIENYNLVSLIHSADLNNGEKENLEQWYRQIVVKADSMVSSALGKREKYLRIIYLLDKFFAETDFSFLYNKERGLFHIGYNVTYEKIDNSYYDFLASEANAVSFIAILKGEVPIKHWSYLGRKLVRTDSRNVLLSSWGGSLFEYLTSLIFFKVHPESLLGHTAKVAIDNHINYGRRYQVPWGMGESAYSALDLNNNYQYQIFGHPALGLKRDLKDYLVVAPYTSIMSLAFNSAKAIINLKKLTKLKFFGRYGFYDAVDYTDNLRDGNSHKPAVPVKIYYAHHQGFSLQALNNQINSDRIYSLFASDPRVDSLSTLFEEKVPSSIPARPLKNMERLSTEYLATGTSDTEIRQFIPLHTSYPRRAFISNGSYSINISNTGAGGSKVSDLCLTRFREDPITEAWGQFIYINDVEKDSLWSPTVQPTSVISDKNKIEFFENKARFNKIHNEVESSLTVAVAPDSDVEFRVLTLTNHSKGKKVLKIASYGEVSLAKYNEDLHHPSFEKLFVRSEYWARYKALVYIRPDKARRGSDVYFAHKVFIPLANKVISGAIANRGDFISRGGSLILQNIFPDEFKKAEQFSEYNFDPIFSLQSQLELKNNETITLFYVNAFGHSKDELIKNLNKYSKPKQIEQAVKKSDRQGHDIINNFGMSREQALNYQALGSRLLSAHYSPKMKKFKEENGEVLVQSLWRSGISGDRPILLVQFYDLTDLALIKNMLICHKYLKYKGVAHDLVLLNEYPSSYIKSFEDEVDFLIRYNQTPEDKIVPGGVFHLRSSHLSSLDKENIIFLAKIIINSKSGPIEQQIQDLLQSKSHLPVSRLKTTKKIVSSSKDIFPSLSRLKFFNGLGGFAEETGEYIMNINYGGSSYTPVPWVNILANKNIGSVITESGSMYTWLFDSYDNRLTKRIDDPLVDKSSEVFYLRDEETGDFWNPTPLPIKNSHTYTVSHGLGYTKFNHKSRGLEQEMSVFVPLTDSIKIINFKFKNTSKSTKKLSLTGFFEMSLGGANREDTKDYLKTVLDEETNTIIVKNAFGESFKDTVAFVDLNGGKNLFTNDREEFLGRGGAISNPVSLHRDKLSNHIYDDVDHCVALQSFFTIEPGEELELNSLIGGGKSLEEVRGLVKKYREQKKCEASFVDLRLSWFNRLNKIQIKTPDESLNTLFNSRLLYQLISSRLLARTGYYQPSGAYGFRDQLQDSLALAWSDPALTKEIILTSSRHQFLEGDAQNWWHEHNYFGVRNVFSDHQLWLPYVVSSYLEITGDMGILEKEESYLKAPLLDFVNNHDWAGVPEITAEKYDIYDHCLRALEKTFAFGKNGLPLIGKGDWNDGLNKVGEKGQGESVWLGWFLYSTIHKFIPYIRERNDLERVKRYEMIAKNLKYSLERNAWDGKWYRRAFFDNGTPLGSRSNKEFKIDSISQSWAVLSGGGRMDRIKVAMNSVIRHLFQNDLLLLISPAIKDSQIDPGYIRDYPAGVRENGAQYNHAALWSAQAFAEIKDSVSMMKIIDSVNPIKRSANFERARLYRVEPYVVASDIYAKPVEVGRGGWTWYTGSAGVMYRTILENILGLRAKNNKLEINPCIPKTWPEFSLEYIYKNTKYNIHVKNGLGLSASHKEIQVDGTVLLGETIDLIDDGEEHKIEVIIK